MGTLLYHRDFTPREATGMLVAAKWGTIKSNQYTPLDYLQSRGIPLQIARGSSPPGVLSHSVVFDLGQGNPIPLPQKFLISAKCYGLKTNRDAAPGGVAGDAFGLAIILDNGNTRVGFNMQTADRTSTPGRGVRMFQGNMPPQETDFVEQSVYDTLYGGRYPDFMLHLLVNKDQALDSYGCLEIYNVLVNAVRPIKYPAGFFDSHLSAIRVLVSSSTGIDLIVSVNVLEFQILEYIR